MTDLAMRGQADTSIDTSVLDRSLVHGVSWTGAVKGITQLLSWLIVIVVARLLTPQDFGLVAMATMFLGLTATALEFGLTFAILTLRDLSEDHIAQLHSVALLVGFLVSAVWCAVAAPLSWWFDAPQLTSVVVALSGSFVLDSLRIVPTALLTRALGFKYLALLDGFRALLAALVTLALAVSGANYWALVLGQVLATTATTLLLLVQRPQRFAWPQFLALKSSLVLSRQLLIGQLAWYGYTNADFLIAGRALGPAALGTYRLAWTLASTLSEKILGMFSRVPTALFAAVKEDRGALRRYFLLLSEVLAMLIVPASAGLALVAQDFVLLALGNKWSATIVPLQFLCWHASINALGTLLAPILQVTGQPMFPVRCGLCALALLPPAFYLLGIHWGTAGIAAAWLLVFPLTLAPEYVRVFRTLGITVPAYFASLWPALRGTAVMSMVVLTLRTLTPGEWPLALRFGLEVACGGATYLTLGFMLHASRLRALVTLLRGSHGGRA
jgi:teichuronic acid exporter